MTQQPTPKHTILLFNVLVWVGSKPDCSKCILFSAQTVHAMLELLDNWHTFVYCTNTMLYALDSVLIGTMNSLCQGDLYNYTLVRLSLFIKEYYGMF